MDIRRSLLALLTGLALTASAHASGRTECPQFFAGGEPPTLRHAPSTRSQQLCFEDFAVLHSGVTKTPLWSAQRLTREQIKRGNGGARNDTFHPEERIARQYRAELKDYKHSRFDRGHMAPDRDAPWSYDLDSLANIVPQAPGLNRGDWAELEQDVRRLAMLRGEVFVLTGVAFDGAPRTIGRGVAVPSHVWKVVYAPRQGDVQGFVAANRDDAIVRVVSLEELEGLAGMRLLPGVRRLQSTKQRRLKDTSLPAH